MNAFSYMLKMVAKLQLKRGGSVGRRVHGGLADNSWISQVQELQEKLDGAMNERVRKLAEGNPPFRVLRCDECPQYFATRDPRAIVCPACASIPPPYQRASGSPRDIVDSEGNLIARCNSIPDQT